MSQPTRHFDPMLSLAVGLPAFIIYLLTLPTDLTWAHYSGDGGELIAASLLVGIPHPPGYPTYILLGKLVRFLPIGNIATRFNLFSAICLTLALILLANTPLPTDKRFSRITIIASTLSCAFAPLIWGQATVTEVYALNGLTVAIVVWLALSKMPAFPLGIAFGVSLTTHLSSIFLLPLLLTSQPPKRWGKMLIGATISSLLWLTLPLLANPDNPVQWGNPTSLKGWWWLVSAQIYRPNLFALPVAEWGNRLASWLPPLLAQFGYIGWGLLLGGLWHNRGRLHQQTWVILLVVGLFWLYAFGYNTIDAGIYALPSLLLLSVVLRLGLRPLSKVAILLPLLIVGLNFQGFSQLKTETVGKEASTLLQGMPAEAILLTPGDSTIFALWYAHHVEQVRSDIILVDENLFAFNWYRDNLAYQYPTLINLAEDNLPEFIAGNQAKYPIIPVQLRN